MKENDELKNLHDKEKEYDDVFEEFINSDEETQFSKNEVEKIIEAHIFKEVLGSYKQNSEEKKKHKNLLVTSKEIGLKLFNIHAIIGFLITYLFFIGFLLIINEIVYPNIFHNKPSVFIIAFGFTVIDKLVRPFVFISDLISMTIHKVGLLTLLIYTVIFYFSSYFLGEMISIEKSLLIVSLVLICMAIIDFLKKDSLFKTKYLDEDELHDGNVEDE